MTTTTNFKPPFRSTGFLDPTSSNWDNCDLNIQSPDYTRDGIQLSPGCTVTVAAFALPDADYFIIDFLAARKEVALHMRARLTDGVLVLNSTIAGKWQSDLRVKKLPLKRGRAFSVSVLATSKAYLIAYDGEHFAAFPHRLPLDAVSSLAISRGLRIAGVYYEVDYKYSALSFTTMESGSDGPRDTHSRTLRSAIYPQLPYRMSLADDSNADGDKAARGGFVSNGACLQMTFKPNFSTKNLTISLGRSDGQARLDLELYINHSQGRVQLHADKASSGGNIKDHSLWSIVGLNRRRHADICVCCSDSVLRVFVCHRPVFQAKRDQLQSLWDRASDLVVKGDDGHLVVAHFCRL